MTTDALVQDLPHLAGPGLPMGTRIAVRDKKVVRFAHWVLWNSQPWPAILIDRLPSGLFMSNIGDPEHGSGQTTGTLGSVTSSLHLELQERLQQLFSQDRTSLEMIYTIFQGPLYLDLE